VKALLLLSVFASGCALGIEGRVPLGHERLTRREAVAIAMEAGVQHGYGNLRVSEVQREDDLWNVELRAAGPAHGNLVIRVDAWNGSVLRFIDEVRWDGRRGQDEHDGHGDNGWHGNHRGHDGHDGHEDDD
jgi:hypothetical protein